MVELNWKNIPMGTLVLKDNKYNFYPKLENIELARMKGCPVDLIIYKKDNTYESDELFYFFNEFIYTDGRIDLDVEDTNNDSDKEMQMKKMMNLARKNQNKDGFWLSLNN